MTATQVAKAPVVEVSDKGQGDQRNLKQVPVWRVASMRVKW